MKRIRAYFDRNFHRLFYGSKCLKIILSENVFGYNDLLVHGVFESEKNLRCLGKDWYLEMNEMEFFEIHMKRQCEKNIKEVKNTGFLPDRCYVVSQSSGGWEGKTLWIESIHYDKSDAERKEKLLLKHMEELRNVPPPFESEEGLTEDELLIYNRWWNRNNDAHELNAPVIKEYFIN